MSDNIYEDEDLVVTRFVGPDLGDGASRRRYGFAPRTNDDYAILTPKQLAVLARVFFAEEEM